MPWDRMPGQMLFSPRRARGAFGGVLGRALGLVHRTRRTGRPRAGSGWPSPTTPGAPADLLPQGMSAYVPDRDLIAFLHSHPRDPGQWHNMVAAAETSEDMCAAFWIMAQPDCDRATVADFFKDRDFFAVFCAMPVDWQAEWAGQVGQVIARWNAGFYTAQTYFSYAVDAPAQQRFHAANVSIAKALGRPRWPVPRGVFRRLDGHVPAPTVPLWPD